MTLKDQMPLQVAFHTRTASIHSSMQHRFKQKLNKRGNVIRVGRLVPFTVAEFRAWLLEKLGGKAEGSTACAYCRTPLFADTLRVDHAEPVSRGGKLGFGNLAVSCDRCNKMKGGLTASEFQNLKIVLGDLLRSGQLHPAGFTDIEKRLCGSAARYGSFHQKKPKPKASGLLIDVPEQQSLLTQRLPRDF
jgi:5-methylcytosine-specific restriction endonuclease McrA